MATSYLLNHRVKTNASYEKLFEALDESLYAFGGSKISNKDKGVIEIQNGKRGITADFLFECDAKISLKKKEEGKYDVKIDINKRPAGVFWLFLIGGICLFWPLLFGNGYYLMIDLGQEYQKKIDRVDDFL